MVCNRSLDVKVVSEGEGILTNCISISDDYGFEPYLV